MKREKEKPEPDFNDDLLLKPAFDFTQDVIDKFYPPNGQEPGQPTQWGKIPFRFFPGELSIWSGMNGHGKSLVMNQVLLDMILQGNSAVIASFEMSAQKTLYRMVRQATGEFKPSEERIKKCLQWLGKRVFIFDKIGTGNVDVIKRIFNRARAQHKVSHYLVDSLMKCGIAPDDYGAQKHFIDTFQNYAQMTGGHVHIIAHSKKLSGEHDLPGKMDVKGASEITDLADNVFSVWRNKKKERQMQEYRDKPDMKPDKKVIEGYDCVLDCSKHREMGGDGEGQFGLFFERESMRFLETQYSRPCYWMEEPDDSRADHY